MRKRRRKTKTKARKANIKVVLTIKKIISGTGEAIILAEQVA